MKIQLLSFPGCPTAGPTRTALLEAMRRAGVSVLIDEIDTTAVTTPEHLRGWASPTVLIDGVDIEGRAEPEGGGCRLYGGRGAPPSVELIERRLRERAER